MDRPPEPSDEIRRRRPRTNAPAGVPRRFGLVTLFVVMTVTAAALGVLRWLDATPGVIGVLAAAFAVIGLAQATLFKGKDPRRASTLTGVVVFAVLASAPVLVTAVTRAAGLWADPLTFVGALLMALGLGAFLGAGCGYCVGVLVAGVFLCSRWLDKEIQPEEEADCTYPAFPADLEEQWQRPAGDDADPEEAD